MPFVTPATIGWDSLENKTSIDLALENDPAHVHAHAQDHAHAHTHTSNRAHTHMRTRGQDPAATETQRDHTLVAEAPIINIMAAINHQDTPDQDHHPDQEHTHTPNTTRTNHATTHTHVAHTLTPQLQRWCLSMAAGQTTEDTATAAETADLEATPHTTEETLDLGHQKEEGLALDLDPTLDVEDRVPENA